MLIAKQNWLMYPDDVENIRTILKKAKLQVTFDGTHWLIYNGKGNRTKKQKDFTIVSDGPFRGARVEPVLVKDVDQVSEIMKKVGLFALKTRETDEEVYFFVGLKSKEAVYNGRMLPK